MLPGNMTGIAECSTMCSWVANALSVSSYSLAELAHQKRLHSGSFGEVCCMGCKRDLKTLIDAADTMVMILRLVCAEAACSACWP